MSNEDESDIMWHTGLHARLDTSFPKKCTNCGRTFETAEQYFTETMDISERDKGLKSFVDEDTATVVEAFRNCPCGSTLMEMFDDHRDSSQQEVARKNREKEFAKSMKVQDPLAENASPEGPTVVNRSGHSEKKVFAGSRNNSPEKAASRKREKELPRSMRTRNPRAGKPSRAAPEELLNEIESGLSELDLLHAEKKWGDEWYSGLRPRGQSAFPKKCQNCGRVYKTADDFFTETANIKPEETGLRASKDEGDGVVIEAYRNCICGSTLMDNFSDRRDMSPAGLERRERFDQMLKYLVRIGLNADIAYTELLKVARGGESEILAKIKPPE